MLTYGPLAARETVGYSPDDGRIITAVMPTKQALERQQCGDDPSFFGAQYAPGAGSGAAVHRFDADAALFKRPDEGPGRLAQTRTGAEQQKFGRRGGVEQVAQRLRRQRVDRRRVGPCQRADGAEQQAVGENVIPHPEAAPLKARDNRSLTAIVTAQFDTSAFALGQGFAPLSRGPTRSACDAMLGLDAFFSDVWGVRPSEISSEDDT